MGKFVFISLILIVPNLGHSASLFKNPGQWFKDTGRAIDKGRRKLHDGVSDVLSFGHCGRERDRARAAEARAIALEKLRSAEKIKQQKARALTERLATLRADNLADRDVLDRIVILANLLDDQKNTTFEMVSLLISSKAELSKIVELVQKQQSDLATFIGDYLAVDKDNKKLKSVKTKIDLHTEQVSQFPVTDWDEENVEELLETAISNSHELILGLQETSQLVRESILTQDESIKVTEADLEELLKDPPAKAQPKKKAPGNHIGVPDRPYRRKDGSWVLVP